MRARYYSANAAMFLSVDPVKNIGPTWRPISYAYGGMNPMSNMDPSGLLFSSIKSAISSIGSKVSSAVQSVKTSVSRVVSAVAKSVTQVVKSGMAKVDTFRQNPLGSILANGQSGGPGRVRGQNRSEDATKAQEYCSLFREAREEGDTAEYWDIHDSAIGMAGANNRSDLITGANQYVRANQRIGGFKDLIYWFGFQTGAVDKFNAIGRGDSSLPDYGKPRKPFNYMEANRRVTTTDIDQIMPNYTARMNEMTFQYELTTWLREEGGCTDEDIQWLMNPEPTR
jgi:hypothetical protein